MSKEKSNGKRLTMGLLLGMIASANAEACCMCTYFPTWSTWIIKPGDPGGDLSNKSMTTSSVTFQQKGVRHVTNVQGAEMCARRNLKKADVSSTTLKAAGGTFWTDNGPISR